MYILVLFLPLLSAIVAGLFGRNLGVRGVGLFTSSCIFLSGVVSYYIFYEVALNSSATYIKLWKWFDLELLTTSFNFQFDGLTSIMLIVITSISTLVHIYSVGYMAGDPHIPRFMCYLSLFTFLMIVLVTSNNYIQLFIGWEGVGLCSYLLINFWLARIKANKAAMKAILINRVGDIGLVLAMFMLFKEFGTLEFLTISGLVEASNRGVIEIICLLLFVGAVGKSAQLGLHTWLPDAMEGPTPVSALIHAATMVTAGVFLIIRSAFLFECAPLALIIVSVIGAITAFFAGTVGVVQNDLKKVVAYSTCSQLGYMMLVCGVSNYSTSLFHLMNHAFFKALLFLSAGSVIHAVGEEQDMRKLGGLIKSIPLTYVAIMIGSLSLMGAPYLTGFYSKDLILELIYDRYFFAFIYWLGSITVLLTAFYSIRLIYLTFIVDPHSKKEALKETQEASSNILVVLIVLALGSVFVGYLGKDVVLSNVLHPIIPGRVKLIPMVFSFLGGLFAFVIYDLGPRYFISSYQSRLYHIIYTFSNSAWQFNYVLNHFVINNMWGFGYVVSYKIIDRGVLEKIGPRGVSAVFSSLTQIWSKFQSGAVFNYAFIMIVFTTLFLWAYLVI